MSLDSLRGLEDEPVLGKAYDARLIRRLWRYVLPYRQRFALVMLLIPVASAAQLAQPYLLKIAIDEHIAVGKLEGLGLLAGALIAALVVQLMVTFAELYQLQALGVRSTNDLRMHVFSKVQRLPQRTFHQVPLGRLMTRMTNDIENITEMFAGGVVTMIADFVTLLGIVAVMLWIDWKLALISFAVVPPLAFLVNAFRLRAREAFRLTRSLVSRINTYLQENLSGMSVVQAFVREKHNLGVFRRLNGDYRDAYFLAIRYDALLYSVVEMIGSVAVAGIVWYAAGDIASGVLTFGVLVAFVEYIQKFFIPIRDLSAKYTVMQSAMASAERVFGLLDAEVAPGGALESLPPLADALRFEGVSYSYDGRERVLRGVDLEVRKGERVALVGATGSGKSTLVRLLLRLYEPGGPLAQGTITFDGRDIRELDPRSLRSHFAVVLQDAFLFQGTLAENITLGEETFTPEEIAAAARGARVDALAARRSEGLQAAVDERGSNLSAGERQLVAFARALIRDPEILVLDEATASVDSETEALLQEAMETLLEDRTAIIIAHRLSTIERADRVVVLHQGRVVEEGPHAELLARGGYYARLYELQYGGGTETSSRTT
ncbi:MAG: ABC transporter ATP-binding protein [Deltaproteobacteria bacterium]|nr:ABC transporter ATP-binding protein [Deltaproteobacteria bacterium]